MSTSAGYFLLVLLAPVGNGAGMTTVPVPFTTRAECMAQGATVAADLTSQGGVLTQKVRYACVQAKR